MAPCHYLLLLVTLLSTLVAFIGATCADGLNSAAHAHSKYFGTACMTVAMANPNYYKLLVDTANFGQITPANAMKWGSIHPQQGTYSYDDADTIVKMVKAHGQLLRCHALVWYQDLPDWVTKGTWTKQSLTAVLQDHIHTVVNRYKGTCYAWDVVNEGLVDDGGLRDNIFLQVIGPQYIPIAFAAAAQADPGAKLYYNDYNIDNDWSHVAAVNSGPPPSRRHSRDVAFPSPANIHNKIDGAKFLAQFVRAAGARIDGIGLQGHYVYNSTPSAAALGKIMSGFTDMGLEVAITELDIRMDLNNINTANTALQSQGFASVVSACRQTPRCVGITLWDFSDYYSWVNTVYHSYGSSLPWDSNLVLKAEIYNAMMGAWCAVT